MVIHVGCILHNFMLKALEAWPISWARGFLPPPLAFLGGLPLVSYPDPNVRKHYRLQYNTAYIGSGQQVEESCSWNVIGMFDNLGCHSNGYVITIKREVCFSRDNI